ncbi:MAG TPA: C40 family peptidase [Solirubrobacteraceae bacterium]
MNAARAAMALCGAMRGAAPAALAAMALCAAIPNTAGAAPADASGGVVAVEPAPATEAAVTAALSKVGAPYAMGAAGPDAFDCSGLVMWALRRADIDAPHSSFGQYGMGKHVGRSDIRRGDLVFFNSFGAGASHVGIATGPASAVSATNHGVMRHPIFDGYWGGHFIGARRIS